MEFLSYLHLCVLASLAFAKDIPNLTAQAASMRETVPASVITPAPVLHGDIFKRSLATCGYVRGNSASPLTCPENYNCMTTVHTEYNFGCCNNIECESDWAICREYGQKGCLGYNLDDAQCISILGPILQCSQEAPHCVRYARTAALGATDTYYSYACGTASTEILVLVTATNGAAQTEASDPTGAGNNPLLSVPGVTLPTGTDTDSTSNSSATSSANKSTLSTTAIVLIAVAGIVVISIALFLGYCCCWRNRKRNANIVHQPQPAQVGYQQTVSAGPAASIHSWGSSVPPGADPNVAPSVVGSDLSGGTAIETRRLMATVHEQPNGYGYGQRHY